MALIARSLQLGGVQLFSLNKANSLTSMPLRNGVNSGLVIIWTLRLGSFLLKRIFQDGEDKRFKGVRNNFKMFFVYFFIQSIWAFVTAFPVYLLNVKQNENLNSSPDSQEPNAAGSLARMTALDVIGWSAWVAGFVLQMTADNQKRAFHALPKEQKVKEFITTGVWSWCQHPNYFGEMTMWSGIFLSCVNQFAGVEKLSIMSPMFVMYLLRYVSGVPLLQKAASKRFGTDPVFQRYARQTNLLFPNPFNTSVKLD